jgi:hypothetical protein
MHLVERLQCPCSALHYHPPTQVPLVSAPMQPSRPQSLCDTVEEKGERGQTPGVLLWVGGRESLMCMCVCVGGGVVHTHLHCTTAELHAPIK